MPRLSHLLVALSLPLLVCLSCGRATTPPAETPETRAPSATPQPPSTARPTPSPTAERTPEGLAQVNPRGQTVTYWHPHTGFREALLLELVDRFNRENEWRITVLAESYNNYRDLNAQLEERLATGQLPHLSTVYPYQIAHYAVQEEQLVALTPYRQSEPWGYTEAEMDDFFPAALETGILPQFDARYGWPAYQSIEVLYYNADWLAELGYETPPQTWELFAESACDAGRRVFSGATGEGVPLGYKYALHAQRFTTLLFSGGGALVNPQGTAYVFDGPQGREVLDRLKDLTERGCIAPMTERYANQVDFSQGWVLFTIGPISNLRYYERAVNEGAGFSWSVNPPPHTGDGEPRVNVHGPAHVIFRSTPQQQLATWLFVRWLSEPEQQAAWARGTDYYPVRRSTAALLEAYFAENPAYAKGFDFLTLPRGRGGAVTGYPQCEAAIEEMLARVLLEDQAAEAALDDAVRACNRALEETTP
jgi:multiple sugar transport system substrate-binding protein/sn-glycerol 3-phosphate transport system substrate-binding protein